MRPLRRSMTLACLVFFILLILLSSLVTYRMYTSSMYERYQKQMASILDYVEAHIDNDDMAECARTYVESEKYRQFQEFFDDFIDHYEDVHYLYIMQIVDPDAPINVREICAANSTYEKLYEPDIVLHLGDGEEGWYDAETAREFQKILQSGEEAYLLNPSEWGVDYTLARPLADSSGEYYGLLCADVSVDELQTVVYRNIWITIAVMVLAGIVFTALLLLWMRANVTKPLRLLEESVADFASKSAGRRDPDELVFIPPDIRTKNEVQSLSVAMKKLSEDMRDYVKDIVAAEDETKGLQAHVTEMNTIAYRDALTKVGNMAAYEKKEESLNWDILNRIAAFGIVMVDLNYLKVINDRYGHDHGNDYIVGACGMLCDVFKHSPVYRIGGDEFVAVIQGHDYENRDALTAELRERFARSTADEAADPWNRYSAAVGMAVYQPGDDVDAVFARADREMYDAKAKMKAERI